MAPLGLAASGGEGSALRLAGASPPPPRLSPRPGGLRAVSGVAAAAPEFPIPARPNLGIGGRGRDAPPESPASAPLPTAAAGGSSASESLPSENPSLSTFLSVSMSPSPIFARVPRTLRPCARLHRVLFRAPRELTILARAHRSSSGSPRVREEPRTDDAVFRYNRATSTRTHARRGIARHQNVRSAGS